MVPLTEQNYDIFAKQNYINHNCLSEEEFQTDLSTISHIKKWINRYNKTGEINERTVLNHFIVLFNVFTKDGALSLLFYHSSESHLSVIKTFLEFLGYCPTTYGDLVIRDIPTDININNLLRNL